MARLAEFAAGMRPGALFWQPQVAARPHFLLSKATKGSKNAFLGDPAGGEPIVSTSKQVLMLAYARLVPHSYHVLHGIAAYQSGSPLWHKSGPTNLPCARGKD